MSQIKIVLTIDIPEGATVATPEVDYADLPQEPPMVAAAMEVFPDAVVTPLPRPASLQAPACPLHGPMTRFPAGVSKKPGAKPYNASWRCATKDCPTKPIWDRDAA